ncbi:MAG TPA: PA2169 family four-helix-bundle protein [Acidobacteriaceae bacterium]|nr:PA2169 family four-helix-bundle protein [Acidobacteriaceae bacterium]
MPTAKGKNQEFEAALKNVIKTLEDSRKGMAEIGDRLEDPELKRFFLAESLKRANFRGELENELHRHGIADVEESGTMAGALYRAWAGLKARLGGTDQSLVSTAEEADRETVQAYQEALDENLPTPVRQLLVEQQTQILSACDFMRESGREYKKAS